MTRWNQWLEKKWETVVEIGRKPMWYWKIYRPNAKKVGTSLIMGLWAIFFEFHLKTVIKWLFELIINIDDACSKLYEMVPPYKTSVLLLTQCLSPLTWCLSPLIWSQSPLTWCLSPLRICPSPLHDVCTPLRDVRPSLDAIVLSDPLIMIYVPFYMHVRPPPYTITGQNCVKHWVQILPWV